MAHEQRPPAVQPTESVRRSPHEVRLVVHPQPGYAPGRIELTDARSGYLLEIPLTEAHLRQFHAVLCAWFGDGEEPTLTNLRRPPGFVVGRQPPRREGP